MKRYMPRRMPQRVGVAPDVAAAVGAPLWKRRCRSGGARFQGPWKSQYDPAMRLDIVHWPDPVLLQPTQPVDTVDEALRQVVSEMRRIMFALRGVGLAAPQVGVQRQVMLVCPTGRPGEETVVLNPEIRVVDGRDVADEGCLSLPGVFGAVPRGLTIQARYQDLELRTHDVELQGFPARVFQHEFDHLQGTMFIDRMAPEARAELEPELAPFVSAFEARQA